MDVTAAAPHFHWNAMRFTLSQKRWRRLGPRGRRPGRAPLGARRGHVHLNACVICLGLALTCLSAVLAQVRETAAFVPD